MFDKITNLLIVASITICFGCVNKSSNQVSFTILQLNDVYEIGPMNNGAVAGLARVSTLRKELLKENRNTITVMAGDFLSPSVIGTMRINGKKVAGKQMVETLNALGLDYATFGNHEFDLKEKDFHQRINESAFEWTTANTLHQTDSGAITFEKKGVSIPRYIIHEIKDENGESVKLGIISVTLPFNITNYVKYEDVFDSFGEVYESIKKECDLVMGLTHLDIDDDIALARKHPDLLMILGGHEHVNSSHLIGRVHVKKADANAKTVYVHRVTFDKTSGKKQVESTLVDITNKIEEDPRVKAIVDKWEEISTDNLNALGYNPDQLIYTMTDTLNVLESDLRNGSTNFTKMVMKAFSYGYPEADAFICNSGSIRLDDILTGEIFEYDILKVFPYGGPLVVVELNGEQLEKALNVSMSENKNTGGFLQTENVTRIDNEWRIRDKTIEPTRNYKVLMPSFLAGGNEQNLEFFGTARSTQLERLGPNQVKNDVRDLVIDYFKTLK